MIATRKLQASKPQLMGNRLVVCPWIERAVQVLSPFRAVERDGREQLG